MSAPAPNQYPRDFERRGQRYAIVNITPHLRRDGVTSKVFTLHTACPICGMTFETTAGPTDLANAKRHLARRCPSCRPKRKPPGPRCAACGQRLREVR